MQKQSKMFIVFEPDKYNKGEWQFTVYPNQREINNATIELANTTSLYDSKQVLDTTLL